jgi:lipoprotein-anchoring transpeptidase ErfK/SrfK
MTKKTLSYWLALPAFVVSVPAVFAQNTPVDAPVVASPTPPTDPQMVPPVAPPVVTQPTPTPKPVPPPVKKPPVPVKKVTKRTDPGDGLRPGQFIWEKRASYKNPLRIIAVLEYQRLYVFDGDDLVALTTISSGRKGHETPTGVFKILQKNINHKSNIYNNAPMPYMQRLTWDGIALHAGAIPGYSASHGCIRMPLPFAKALYGVTKMDQEVIVIADTSKAKQNSETPQEEVKPVEPSPVDPEKPTPEATPEA